MKKPDRLDELDETIPAIVRKSKKTDLPEEAGLVADDVPDLISDFPFDYEGYQVVRGEFFSHLSEPALSFSFNKIYVNQACLRKLPGVDYVQILVNTDEKKLVIRPAEEDEKDAFLWINRKRKPKQITCRVFYAKIISLLGWNSDYRYKLLGKLIRSGEERLLVFDLTATEIFVRLVKEDGKYKSSRRPVFPAEWENQFGLPVEEHRKQLQINIFNGYTVFGIQNIAPVPDITDKESHLEGNEQ